MGEPRWSAYGWARQATSDAEGKTSSARVISISSHGMGVLGFACLIVGAWFHLPEIPHAELIIPMLIGGGFATNAAGRLGK